MKMHCVETKNKTKNHQTKKVVINKLKEDKIYKKKNGYVTICHSCPFFMFVVRNLRLNLRQI